MVQVLQGLIALSSGRNSWCRFWSWSSWLGPGPGRPIRYGSHCLRRRVGISGTFRHSRLYLLLVYRGFRIAMEATDTFSQLLAAGLTSIFAIQTLIICRWQLETLALDGYSTALPELWR